MQKLRANIFIAILFSILLVCNGVMAQTLNEGFEASVPPTGWLLIDNNSDGSTFSQSSADARSGSYHARYTYSGLNTGDDYLITPLLYPSSGDNTFNFYANGSSTFPESVSVKLSTTNTSVSSFTVTLLSNYTLDNNAYELVSVDLSAYNGQEIYIAIVATSVADQFHMEIDDVTGPSTAPLETTWTGATDTNWNTSSNWTNGIPTIYNDAIIPDVANDPTIGSSFSPVCDNLTINSGAVVTFASTTNDFNVNGSLINNGTITNTGSRKVYLDGSSKSVSGTGDMSTVDYWVSGSYTFSDSFTFNSLNTGNSASVTFANGTTSIILDALYNRSSSTITLIGTANLTVDGTANLAEESGSIFTLNSGILDLNGITYLTGTSNGTFNANSGTVKISGTYSNLNTLNAGTSTFEFDGSSAQTINNTNTSVSYASSSATTVLLNQSFTSEPLGEYTTTSSELTEYQAGTGSDGDEVWSVVNSSTDDDAGFCTGCSGQWLQIKFSSTYNQQLTWFSDAFTPSTASLAISFDYRLNELYEASYSVTLYNETDDADVSTLINLTDDANSSYSAMTTLSGANSITDSYRIKVYYSGDDDYAATFDNLLITEDVTNPANFSLTNEFYNVIINNSAGINLETTDFGLSNNLTLTAGVLTTGSDDTLFIESTTAGALSAGSGNSFIYGYVKFNITSNTDTYTLPLGEGTSFSDYYRIDLINNSLSGTAYITASMVLGSPNGYNAATLSACNYSSTQDGTTAFDLKELSSDGYLVLTPDQQPSSGSYDLNMYVDNYTKSTWVDNKIAVFKRSEGSSSNCDWAVGGTIPSDGAIGRLKGGSYLSFSGASSFSEFVPGGEGGGGGVALPIELGYFDANLNSNHQVQVTWATLSELNNDYFVIERTLDGQEYETVEVISSAGNSIVQIDYEIIDSKPLKGISYYRLRQVDFDNTTTLSDIVTINNKVEVEEVGPSFEVFYSSDLNKVWLNYDSIESSGNSISIYDISGRKVFEQTLIHSSGQLSLSNDLNLSGIYLVYFQSHRKSLVEKIRINIID